jgi:hypothetical protein
MTIQPRRRHDISDEVRENSNRILPTEKKVVAARRMTIGFSSIRCDGRLLS